MEKGKGEEWGSAGTRISKFSFSWKNEKRQKEGRINGPSPPGEKSEKG